MTLLELLVQELPKRGGWPDGATCAAQDPDKLVMFATCDVKSVYRRTDGSWNLNASRLNGNGDEGYELADDHAQFITREQYEAALAARKEMIINKPDSDGWISWCGGECPVDGDVVVDVKFRAQGQADLDGDVADNFRWEHFSNGADIVAYRLRKSEHQKPEWDGEGLPPVGVDVLVTPHNNHWGFSSVGEFSGKVLAFDGEDFWFKLTNGGKIASRTDKVDFRPIRTEQEKKKLSAIDSLVEFKISYHSHPKAAEEYLREMSSLYDAIAAGKIPHVHIE